MRKAGASTLEAANEYLERVYLPMWNERFTVEPANGSDAHRPLLKEHELAAILSHVEQRVVINDYSFRFGSELWTGFQLCCGGIRALLWVANL